MMINSIKNILFLFYLFYFAILSHGQKTDVISQNQVNTFQKFLLDSLPKGTPWYYESYSAQQKKEMKRILKTAVPLKFFEPYYLIKLIYWNPAAGYPGMVMHDYRILYNPEKNSFETSSLQWIKNYRRKSHIGIDTLNLSDAQSYIEEFVSLIPRLDNYGFNISRMAKEKPLHFRMVYNNRNPRREKPIDEIMIFDKNGVLTKSKLLESLKAHWTKKGRW